MATSNELTDTHLLRLELSPVRGRGPLDGAWWPRSRDLDVELADLVDHFPEEVGRVSRAIFSPPDWLTSPRRVRVARGEMKTGSFPRDDTHVVLLKLASGAELKVLVVPPDTSADTARSLMATAATPGNVRPATELLAATSEARS